MSAEPERKDQLAALASLRIQRDAAPEPERPSRVPWGWLFLLAVLGTAVFFLWRPARQLYQDRTMPPPEQSVVVRTGGAQILLTASGYVNAEAVVDVGTTIAGRLRRLEVKKGAHVKRGQILAVVDDEELIAQRMLAKANLDDAVRSHERAAALIKSGAGTPQEVDKAQAMVDVSKANVALIDARLRQTRILSPIDGKVLDTLADPGEILSFTPTASAGGMAIVRLGDLSKTVVEVDVNETDIGKLEPEQPAQITLDAFPGKGYTGKLLEIAQIADKAKATVQVKVRISNPDDDVRPNMSAKVVFRPEGADLADKGRLLLPRRALVAAGGSPAVFVVKSGRIERRAIETKPAEGDFVELTGGLSEGETILTSQLDRWKDGDKLPETKTKKE